MIKKIICVLLWSGLTAASVLGAELSDIILDDGSILRGEVISFQDNIYTLRSSSMGEFKLDASRVTQIRHYRANQIPASTAPAQAGTAFSGSSEALKAQVESTQTALMNDPETMREAMLMASDPDFQKLMEDPEALAALKSLDMNTLLKNPKFLAIMQNPRMQGIATKLKKDQ